MSNQPDVTDVYGIIGGLLTGFVGSFIALKNSKQTAEKKLSRRFTKVSESTLDTHRGS